MQVILLERIGRIGQMGDIVTVKDGFARNYLLPRGKALRATKANLERFQAERVHLEARNLELKREAEAVARKMDGASFTVIRQAGDSGQLYGSVATRDVAQMVTQGGFSIERRQILLDRPIKAIGLHAVRIALHPEVEVSVTVNVARTEEEAERQARGEDVTAARAEAEGAFEMEEAFEAEELAHEAREELEKGEPSPDDQARPTAAKPEEAGGRTS